MLAPPESGLPERLVGLPQGFTCAHFLQVEKA